MRDVAFWFFLIAVICVFTGMVWGIQMAVSHNHQFAGAHAHLNLVGWTTMALFGLYYRATPQAACTRLARVHLATATLGVLVMVPGIAIAVTSGASGLAAAGAILTFLSMAIFLYTVTCNGFGQKIARADGMG